MTTTKKRKRKGGLSDAHRAFIVQQLAAFMGPSETAEAVNEKFGLDVSRQAMERYDPNKHAGRRIAQKWKDLFEYTRQAFLDDVTARVPESFKSVRVQELARASRIFKKNGNLMAQAAMLERVAKEMGNIHTNRYEFTGRDRGPIKFQDVDDMTDDQIDQELRRLLNIKSDADIHPAPESQQ